MIKDSLCRWAVVAAGGIMGCAAMGALSELPVLLQPMADAMGWSRTGLSWAMTLGFLSMAATSMIRGSLSDRFGARPVVMAGAALFSTSLWLAGHAPMLLAVQLAYGVMAGGAVAAFFVPDRDGLVHQAARPCRVAGLRRDGPCAADHVALGGEPDRHA